MQLAYAVLPILEVDSDPWKTCALKRSWLQKGLANPQRTPLKSSSCAISTRESHANVHACQSHFWNMIKQLFHHLLLLYVVVFFFFLHKKVLPAVQYKLQSAAPANSSLHGAEHPRQHAANPSLGDKLNLLPITSITVAYLQIIWNCSMGKLEFLGIIFLMLITFRIYILLSTLSPSWTKALKHVIAKTKTVDSPVDFTFRARVFVGNLIDLNLIHPDLLASVMAASPSLAYLGDMLGVPKQELQKG